MLAEILTLLTRNAIIVIDFMAFAVIVYGTVEAFFYGVKALLSSADGHTRRDVWLRYARWLVAGLTFQLAADILETSITSDWESVGRIAVIAAVRTLLNFFLERDLEEVRARQRDVSSKGGGHAAT